MVLGSQAHFKSINSLIHENGYPFIYLFLQDFFSMLKSFALYGPVCSHLNFFLNISFFLMLL